MSKPPLPEAFTALADTLEHVGGRFRLAYLLGGAGRFLAVVIPAALAALLLAGKTPPAVGWQLGLLGALGAVTLWAYAAFLHRTLFHRPTPAEIARWVEEQAERQQRPLHNRLINAVLLAREWETPGPAGAAKPMIPHVLKEIQAETKPEELLATVPWGQQRRPVALAAVTLLLAAGVVVAYPGALAHGLSVLASPGKFVPRQGSVAILSVIPGHDTVLAGQSESFGVEVQAPDAKLVKTTLHLQFAGGKKLDVPMTVTGTENKQYRYTLASVAEDATYFITAGDTESERYKLTVRPQIHLIAYKLKLTPPSYTAKAVQEVNLSGKDVSAAKGSVDAPLGSEVELTVQLDHPVHTALLDVVGGKPVELTPDGTGTTFSTRLKLADTVRFGVLANDSSGRTLRRFPDEGDAAVGATTSALNTFALGVIPDQPPTVQITEPGRDLDAKPGESLPLAFTAADDYGLAEITLELAKNKDEKFLTVQRWPVKPDAAGKPTRSYQVKHLLPLPAEQYKFGDTARYRVTVTDNRHLEALSSDLGPQTSTSQVFSIAFNDTAAAKAKSSALWDELRKRLSELLERENKLRAEADGLKPALALAEVKALSGRIGAGQQKLRSDLDQLAKTYPFEASMKLIQRTLQVLVVEDATAAVDRAADLGGLAETKAMTPIATKLRQHQSRIIDTLEALLAMATSEQKQNPLAVEKPGGDLPNENKEAWKKLAEELKKFEKEQKAVIDSTADLAKKPKDQFDKNDDKKLSDLAALEDKWEKFMNQAMVDMSKIAEQDQANASLLDELVQMKIELAMVKDALKAQALEIATPLEENGLENAKELTTHIERWLSQQPDRTNWQMEEPLAQNDTPMAELPKQLQDMVGDLMDQEEDLTEEMESMGSKWADSLDKGAGWDALDGPISNMSAQGVTGNQTPKNMEIQGRSGEGREGRSSGEFVGKEAEGKGGRRTPTRMTQDAFSSGKVDDKSKDPPGGATGGGKKGNFGAEGLEGPAPQEMRDPMQRLQGKQAALRNQNERLQLQMKAAGFNNFKLLESAVLMRKADEALQQYHYRTALYYQKEAVQSLNTAKVLASGQVHVTLDTTPTASEKTQKDLEDALHHEMPKGFSDPVKAYFTKLATDGGEAK